RASPLLGRPRQSRPRPLQRSLFPETSVPIVLGPPKVELGLRPRRASRLFVAAQFASRFLQELHPQKGDERSSCHWQNRYRWSRFSAEGLYSPSMLYSYRLPTLGSLQMSRAL